jgi:nitroreductase
MKITLDTLMERRSVRSFSGKPLSPDEFVLLEQVMEEQARLCPFGNRPRFMLTGPGLARMNPDRPLNTNTGSAGASGVHHESGGIKIGTYGVIKSPPAFILGAVAAGPDAVLDYGYALEGIILAATATGLGTCWLGGTFARTSVKELLALRDGEIIPAITPVGMAADKQSLTERTMRFFARSDSRKPWDSLFFDGQPGTPLDKATAGQWAPVLEAVRMGPSASNKQPWRILREGPSRFSLLFAEDKKYNNALGLPIQELDLGIAMKHFELAAAACGLAGHWYRNNSGDSAEFSVASGESVGSFAYIATWGT